MDELGATAIVLPELEALRGIEQNRFHHLDVYGHTLEVLDRTIELQGRPWRRSSARGADRRSVETIAAALLDEPLADEMTRGEALRWGALLHDAAKPLTTRGAPAGRPRDLHRPRRQRRRAGAGRCSDGCARASALRCARRRAGAQPPATRLPRPRAPAARASHRVRLSAGMRAGGGRCHAAVGRRPAGHARRGRPAGDRRASSRVARGMLGDALRWRARGCRPSRCCEATSWRRSSGLPPGRESASCWGSSPRRSMRARSPRASRHSPTCAGAGRGTAGRPAIRIGFER